VEKRRLLKEEESNSASFEPRSCHTHLPRKKKGEQRDWKNGSQESKLRRGRTIHTLACMLIHGFDPENSRKEKLKIGLVISLAS